MKNLGKIILSIMIAQTLLVASIKARLAQNPIFEGESAILLIEATGKDVVFPDIKEIGGIRVAHSTTTQNLTSRGGKMYKTMIKKYRFMPLKNMRIPTFDVVVDGKKYHTKPLLLKIKQDIKNGKKAFIFEQKIDKKSAYVGEPIQLTYIFKQRKDIDLSEANFNPPSFKGFWTKTTGKVPNTIKDGYNLYQINYLLYPQKEGRLKIESGRMDVGILSVKTRDFFNFKQARWKTIYSNPLEVEVKALPAGVTLYGDYTFSVVADKNRTKSNEPVNLTITIQGEGNVDDIEDFTLQIPNATVYADKAKRTSNLSHKRLRTLFKQKFAIVSDRNFTIPSLHFRFFNGAVQERDSKSVAVEIINAKKSPIKSTLEKKELILPTLQEKSHYTTPVKTAIMIVALIAFMLGMLVMWLLLRKRKRDEKEQSIQTAIKSAKEDKALLSLLLPYMDKSRHLAAIVEQLEENIYHDSAHKIDRRTLAKMFDTLLKDRQEEEILKG